MDSSVRPTIEKIKLKEQEEEMRLREKREFNDAIMSLNRAIHDTTTNIDKLTKEYQTLVTITDKLQSQLIIEKSRQHAFAEQMNVCRKELDELQKASASGISSVWEKRAELFETVQSISDKCDIWALLIKPKLEIPPNQISHKQVSEQVILDDTKLKAAIERKHNAITLRNFLLNEPDVGEEFVRNFNRVYRSKRTFSSKLEESENAPIRFSTSGAARKSVTPVIKKVTSDMPWYQPYSVVTSVAVFLIYFCVLREESDIDREFDKTLYERIKGLEKEQLIQSYKYNKEQGKSVAEIEMRLKELELAENK